MSYSSFVARDWSVWNNLGILGLSRRSNQKQPFVDVDIRVRKSSLNNRSMCLKAYQMPEHGTAVSNTMRPNCTTLQSYHSGSHFIFQTAQLPCPLLQSNPPGVYAFEQPVQSQVQLFWWTTPSLFLPGPSAWHCRSERGGCSFSFSVCQYCKIMRNLLNVVAYFSRMT